MICYIAWWISFKNWRIQNKKQWSCSFFFFSLSFVRIIFISLHWTLLKPNTEKELLWIGKVSVVYYYYLMLFCYCCFFFGYLILPCHSLPSPPYDMLFRIYELKERKNKIQFYLLAHFILFNYFINFHFSSVHVLWIDLRLSGLCD